MIVIVEEASEITKTCVAELSELGHGATKPSAELFNAIRVRWGVADLVERWEIDRVGVQRNTDMDESAPLGLVGPLIITLVWSLPLIWLTT